MSHVMTRRSFSLMFKDDGFVVIIRGSERSKKDLV